LLDAIAALPEGEITPELRAEIEARFPDASESDVRHALIESGRPLHALVEGVRQDDFGELERTLLALEGAYSAADSSQGRRAVRAIVILARTHAQWAVRNPKVDEAKRSVKEEMAEWMRVWLENPPLFGPWSAIRKKLISCQRSRSEGSSITDRN
jgi:hypothetical protein